MTSERLVAAAYAALAIVVLAAGIWFLRRLVGDAPPAGKPANGLDGRASPVSMNRMTISPFVSGVICVLIMAAFVIPIEATSIAAQPPDAAAGGFTACAGGVSGETGAP